MQVEDINLSQYVNITIRKKKEQYYNEFFEELEKVKNLIMFSTGQNVHIKKINCFRDDKYYMIGEKKQFHSYQMIDYRINDENENIAVRDIRNYLFKLSDLKENNNLKSWFKEYKKYEKIYELYLLSIKNEVPAEIRFCNYIQALELLHRQKYKKYSNSFKKHIREKFADNEDMKNEIFENSDQKSSYYITLRSRMIDIFTQDNKLLKAKTITDNIVRLSEIMCDTRNYYTHYDDSKKDKCLVKQNLFFGIEFASHILSCMLLEKMGFNRIFIDEKTKEKMQYLLDDDRILKILNNER